MAKIDVDLIAQESQAKTFDGFVDNFQENIQNLQARQKFSAIQTDKEYQLDEDGYIIGDVWSERIASEIMDLNGFQATIHRIDALVEARIIYGKASVPTDYKVVAEVILLNNFKLNKYLDLFKKNHNPYNLEYMGKDK